MSIIGRVKNLLGIDENTEQHFKPMLAYNAANITLGGAGYPLSLYHQQFLSFVEGLPTDKMGNISGINGLVDAFTDILMGAITDNTRSRFGKHRRYLLLGAFPFAIAYAMRWSSFGLSASGNTTSIFFYYLFAALLYSSGYTMLSVPHTAMLPQIAPQYFLRTQFKIVEYAFNSVGQISSFLLMGLVLGGTNMPDPSPADRGKYMWVGIVLSLWFVWPPLLAFFKTEAPSSLDMPRKGMNIYSIFYDYGLVFKNKAFRQYFFMGLFNMISHGFYGFTDQFFILSIANRYNRFNVINVIGGVAEFCGAPLNYLLTKNKGKQFCGLLLSPLKIIGLLLSLPITHKTPTIVLYIAAIFYNFGFSGPGFTIQNIQPDVTDIDELMTGKRREGIISTANLFFKKTVGSGMNFILGNLLRYVFKYDTQKKQYFEQTNISKLGLRLCFSVFPAIAAFITLMLITRYRLTKSDHERIKELIEEKHETGLATASEEEIKRIENITGKLWHEMWIGIPSTETSHQSI